MLESQSANCRVEGRIAVSGYVIILEREITDGSVLRTYKIFKKREIAKSVVAKSAGVIPERKGAYSIIEVAVVVFCVSLGSEQTKNTTGQRSFVCFRIVRRDTEFLVLNINTFVKVFRMASLYSSFVSSAFERLGCYDAAMPAANPSG